MRNLPMALLAFFLVAVVAFAGTPAPTSAQRADDPPPSPPSGNVGVESRPGIQIPVRLEDVQHHTIVPRDGPSGPGTASVTITVNYTGFSAPAQAAFQYAVDIWAAELTSAVPVVVNAQWTNLGGGGILGSAGPSTFLRQSSNPCAGVILNRWYPISLLNKLCGSDLAVGTADIDASFNSSFTSWYFGTDGNPPSNQIDFVSVVLHELGHGFGSVDLFDVSGGIGSYGGGTAFPSIFDIFVVDAANQPIWSSYPNNSAAMGTALSNNAVSWNGDNAVGANGGTRPPLYAPNPYQPGSSIAHLNEATFPAANPNSLMTPQIGFDEAIHSPGPIFRGMLKDMGWTVSSGSTATNLGFTTQPSASNTTGTAFATQPVVAVRDAANATVTTDNTTVVTLALTGGAGTLSCTGGNSKTVVAGVATFAGCKVTNANGTGYQLNATSAPVLTPATSTAFSVIAFQMAWAQNPPANNTSGVPFATQPMVMVQDSTGTTITNDSSTQITLALSGGTGSGTLSCTGGNTKTVVAGTATFAGCAVTGNITGTRLQATAVPVLPSSQSSLFNVTGPVPTNLAFTQQPAGAPAGTSFATMPQVSVRDASNNVITTDNATVVTLSLASGTGQLSCTGGLARVAVNGVASWSGCTITAANPSATINASAVGLTGATSGSIVIGAVPSGSGQLRAFSSPALPTTIHLNGIPRDTWATTWVKLPPGNYELSFSEVPGFKPPAPQTIVITNGGTVTQQGNFTQLGILQIATSPPVPGTVSINGTPRDDWGVYTYIEPGTYQVCFGLVAGFNAPACQNSVVVTAGSQTNVTGVYTTNAGAPGPGGQFGYLRALTNPALPLLVMTDGNIANTWATTWVKLATGRHAVAFSAAPGFAPPPPVTVDITNGATSSVTGNAQQQGVLQVNTNPAVPGTISIDGIPRNDWGVFTWLNPGTYQVCFGPVAGFSGTPACQPAVVTAGNQTTITGNYTP